MEIADILDRLNELEERVRSYEEKESQWQDKEQLLLQRIAELEDTIKNLEEALKNKADSKASQKPNLNYGVDRNKPDSQKKKKKWKRKPSTGRVPDAQKFEKANDIVDIYPANTKRSDCVLRDEQGVWRLIEGKRDGRLQTADGSRIGDTVADSLFCRLLTAVCHLSS